MSFFKHRTLDSPSQYDLHIPQKGLLIALAAVMFTFLWQQRHVQNNAIWADQTIGLQLQQNIQMMNQVVRLQQELRHSNQKLDSIYQHLYSSGKVIQKLSRGVCLIQGEYIFIDPATHLPISNEQVSFPDAPDRTGSLLDPTAGESPISQEKTALNPNNPAQPPLRVQYTGTAFLIDKRGYLVTNKHVTTPWLYSEKYRLILAAGYKPQMLIFRAFFPGFSRPFEVELYARSDDEDVALLHCDLGNANLPTLPCVPDGHTIQMGQTVTVLGYPTGFDLLLARINERDRQLLLGSAGKTFDELASVLAQRGLIQPVATRGICGQEQFGRIVYDAPTASGGSGGPVLNENGQVVAINTALMKGFWGTNFGIPINRAMQLLKTTMDKKNFP